MQELLQICEREGIHVSYQTLLPSRGLLGIYIPSHCGGPLIILDRGLATQSRLARCVLAEELGHHFTSSTQTLLCASFSLERLLETGGLETKALRWACDHLIPLDKLYKALRQGPTFEDLVNQFDVTREMMFLGLEYRRGRLGRSDVRDAFYRAYNEVLPEINTRLLAAHRRLLAYAGYGAAR